jgi:solute carrier family 25 uncoupling protein 8/9
LLLLRCLQVHCILQQHFTFPALQQQPRSDALSICLTPSHCCFIVCTAAQVRAAVLTASQCVTYDEVKGRVMAATGWRDSAATHLATAMITGIVSTTATNPVDVIKTHMFVGEWRRLQQCALHAVQGHAYLLLCTESTCAASLGQLGCLPRSRCTVVNSCWLHLPPPADICLCAIHAGGRKHSGPLACAASLYAAHGLGGFWRGWLANYARLGPQTVVTFLVVEQLRRAMGLAPLGK